MSATKKFVVVAVIAASVWAYSKYWSLVHGADGDRQE